VPHDACHKKRLKSSSIDLGHQPSRRAARLLVQAKDAVFDVIRELGGPQAQPVAGKERCHRQRIM
jgi:hypothetical protein